MTTQSIKRTYLLALTIFLSFTLNSVAQDGELISEGQTALGQMFKKAPELQEKVNSAYGYAIFPEIKKAGLIIGGAGGKGVVYQGGAVIGESKMSQASIGAQLGAQKYMQLILFKNVEAYDSFTGGKLKFDAQVSAVAIEADSGSFNTPYKSGFLIYTMADGGLMFAATVAGQKFSFEGEESK